jgi:arachidonate 15-lipoxygenase
MHTSAPQVLLYTSGDKKVLPYAIHFSDGENTHRVVTADDKQPNTWLLAKIHANSADLQLYQFIYHLGMAHLCAEPFVVGVHNVFTIKDKDHFMSRLLRPHFKNLLGINHFASISLISEVAPLTD